MMIIVESGATKSDWRKTDASGKVISRQLLPGMNVSTVSMDHIKEILAEGLSASEASPEDTLYLYTAGIVTDAVREELTDFILSKVRLREIDIQTDLVGAARSILGGNPGIVAIMGTGSNACFYDGKSVSQKVMAGGFIIGDDGSGAALGKLFITDFIKNLIPDDVAADFASKFDASYPAIVENVYHSASPSGYLGSLAPFVLSHYGNPYIRELVEYNFRRFIDRSLKCYDTGRYPVGVVGGFGYATRDIFTAMCLSNGIRLAGFVPEPIEGLIGYHLTGGHFASESPVGQRFLRFHFHSLPEG